MANRINMTEGSSIDPEIIDRVRTMADGYRRILVCLGSNHTHAHVLAELEASAPLVTPGSDCVVFDTLIEDMPADMFPDRPWGPGDNPKTAVRGAGRRRHRVHQGHLGEWLAEQSLAKPPAVYEVEPREHTVRV